MKIPECLVIGCALAFQSAGADILIDNYSSGANDRFQDNDTPDEFILSSFDLSGVGQDGSGRWATLIGPNTIISANHFRPSGTISFYPGNDPTTAAVELGLSADSVRIGDTDLWLARLDEFAPSSLGVFDYATTNISEPSGGSPFPFEGESAYMTGRSPGTFPAEEDQVYGENVISGFLEDDTSTSLGTLDVLELDYNSGDTTYESFLRSGDSGAPLFTEDGEGGLLLMGVNSYTTTSDGDPVASYVSYTGNDSDAIDNQVATWAAIPEPSASLLLGASCLVLLRRRRVS